MELKRYEQETIINYSADEEWAHICTTTPAIIRRLNKLCDKFPEHYIPVKKEFAPETAFYKVPKRMIRFSTPRMLTKEQKEAATLRLKASGAANASNKAPGAPERSGNDI